MYIYIYIYKYIYIYTYKNAYTLIIYKVRAPLRHERVASHPPRCTSRDWAPLNPRDAPSCPSVVIGSSGSDKQKMGLPCGSTKTS